jgi:hypothetical protein
LGITILLSHRNATLGKARARSYHEASAIAKAGPGPFRCTRRSSDLLWPL